MTYEEIKEFLNQTMENALVGLDLNLNEIRRLKSNLKKMRGISISDFRDCCDFTNYFLKLGLEFKDESDYDKVFEAIDAVEEKVLIDKKQTLSVLRSIKSDFTKGVDDLAFMMVNIVNCIGYEFKNCGDIIVKLLKANFNQVKGGKFRKFSLNLPNIREYELELYNALENKDVKTFKDVFDRYIEELLNSEEIKDLIIIHNADAYVIKGRFYVIAGYIIGEYFRNSKLEVSKESEGTLLDTGINEYISNGKVIKVCSHEELASILVASNVSKGQQEEYLKQLTNLIAREEAALREAQKNEVMVKVLSQEEIEVYNLGKVANSIEASEVIKDIDALLELLGDDFVEEEQVELVRECQSYIAYLKDLVVKKEEVLEEIPQVIYYKDQARVSLLARSVDKAQRGMHKGILANLNKIIEGNTANDKLLMWNKLPIKVYFKGKDFLIFYTVINNVTCVIGGYSKDSAFQEIGKVINSKEFLEYIEDVKVSVKNGVVFDERGYTESIISQLEGNKARK